MKKITMFIMLCIITITVNANSIIKNGPWKAKVTIKVLDSQTLKPLQNCKVTLTSYFDKNIYDKFKGHTDLKGLYIFEGKVYVLKALFKKDGYYNSYTDINFNLSKFDCSKGAIYQPWNQEIVVKLRKQIDPTPMYVQRVDEDKVPKFGYACGYDLIVGDWVKPYGQGKVSDFILKNEGFIKPPLKKFGGNIFDLKLTLTFSNPNDGIQKMIFKKEKKTGFASKINRDYEFIYEAPLTGYKPILQEHYSFDGKKRVSTHDSNVNYVFRIRTKTNKKGKIISALYGKIYGQIEHGKYIQFIYYVNPTPNSRSMEWNGKNVIKRLKGKNYNVQEL